MQKRWANALKIELKTQQVISEQARYGWLFDSHKCKTLVKRIRYDMHTIEKALVPHLPIHVKQYGVTVLEPFKIDGTCKKMVTDWLPTCYGAFTRVEFFATELGSDKQVKEYLLSQGWKPTWWNFSKKTGERTSPKLTDDKQMCPNLDELDSKFAVKIVQYLKLKHRKGLLIGLMKVVRPDGRISGEANTLGTASHRMAHKKIVNIPGKDAFLGEEIRSLFISKKGYSIVGCDSKSNQLRMLCHYMGDPVYTEAVLSGDIHTLNQEKAGLPTRRMAKTFIYGFLFGAGDAKIGKIIGKGAGAGRVIKNTFLNSLPKLKRLVQSLQRKYDKGGFIYGLDGRKIWIGSSHKALNYLLQGGEAVYMKYSLCFLYKYIKDEGLDAHFVAMIHDEYQLEVLNEHVERVKELCLKAMLVAGTYLKITVKMEGDVNVGNSWRETH